MCATYHVEKDVKFGETTTHAPNSPIKRHSHLISDKLFFCFIDGMNPHWELCEALKQVSRRIQIFVVGCMNTINDVVSEYIVVGTAFIRCRTIRTRTITPVLGSIQIPWWHFGGRSFSVQLSCRRTQLACLRTLISNISTGKRKKSINFNTIKRQLLLISSSFNWVNDWHHRVIIHSVSHVESYKTLSFPFNVMYPSLQNFTNNKGRSRRIG